MYNHNWSRSEIAQELEDTLKFGGLIANWNNVRTKEHDVKGKSFYMLCFIGGCVKVYGPGFIIVNNEVCRSVGEAKRLLQFEYII